MNPALPIRQVAKPWGSAVLPAPFAAPAGERIGEIWFEPPPELPQLLVKYIFTGENLSVQVHPSDAQVPGEGKEECWLIVAAEPGAKLGIGFREPLTGGAMRRAALDGSIEHLLDWHPVKPGDFFYIPANTVHAIGAGVSLIEVQQNSDTTYRLYDYGRPRELHLDAAVAVADGRPYETKWRSHVAPGAAATLVTGPLFRLDQVIGGPAPEVAARYGASPLLIVPREGPVRVRGMEVTPGSCALAGSLADAEFAGSGEALITQPCG